MRAKATQSCQTLSDPTDYTVPGILQARVLEWVAYPFSRGLPNPGAPNCRRILCQLSHQGNPQRADIRANKLESQVHRVMLGMVLKMTF